MNYLLTYSEMCLKLNKLLTFILTSLTISVEKKARSSQEFNFQVYQEQRPENKFDLDKNVRVKIIYPSHYAIF